MISVKSEQIMEVEAEEEQLTREGLILIYLLMAADGEVSEIESARFDELLEAYELNSEKNSIIGNAKDILSKLSPEEADNMETLYALYKESSMKSDVYFFHWMPKRLLLWTMVNMAFADQIIATNEKNLLEVVAKESDCEWSVVEQMLDAAKALYALDVQRNWLKTEVSKPYCEIEALVKELDKNQEVIKKNLEILF